MPNKQNLNQKIKDVAKRIKTAREAVGITVEQAASELELPVEEYMKYEDGLIDFNFTFIYKIAKICNVEITDIMEGQSPILSTYTVTRKGEGTPIVRRKGFEYYRLAPLFKGKLAEPFLVTIPYSEEALSRPPHYSTHAGQELDIVISGTLKMIVGENSEILHEGDAIFYDSSNPHDEIALGGEPCSIYAVVMNPKGGIADYKETDAPSSCYCNFDLAKVKDPVSDPFVTTELNENGSLKSIAFKNEDKFNFAFDIVDKLAEKCPDKRAMVYVDNDLKDRFFTFKEIMEETNRTANYLLSLGIKRGDKVMLVLKRHYQFWFSILALHKIGAVVIPATNLLMEHDFDYRFKAANVKALLCTADGVTAAEAEKAAEKLNRPLLKIIVNGEKEGWYNFNEEYKNFSDKFERTADAPCGDDDMLMFFTSGTTGYPKIATHSYKYPLGHFITAKYWHNVDPNGLHFTMADTGWGKALWGKLYGQWMCETCVFVYDFNKFNAADVLELFAKYKITTFCAPPTIYRFFIKENLAKYDLSTVKYSTIAGEALNPEVYYQWHKATGIRLMEGFGQTETTLVVANLVGSKVKPGSMGKPSPLYKADIVDDNGQPTKVGEIGEIIIHTDESVPCGLFKGYYKDAEATKKAHHDGIYHTGDTAWRDEEGYFWYVGRTDDVIKSSGYRIGPFEIESVIMELPYVLECAVTAVPDEVRGQVVKATIVLTKGTEGTEELKKEIQQYVKKNTAPYKYPRIVEFMDELPKTISGKIRRVELRGNK